MNQLIAALKQWSVNDQLVYAKIVRQENSHVGRHWDLGEPENQINEREKKWYVHYLTTDIFGKISLGSNYKNIFEVQRVVEFVYKTVEKLKLRVPHFLVRVFLDITKDSEALLDVDEKLLIPKALGNNWFIRFFGAILAG